MSRKAARKRAKKRRMGALLVFLVLIIIVAIFLIQRFAPGKENADLNEYFNIQTADDMGVVWQDTKSDTVGKVYDGHVYVEYEFLKNNINPIFYFDYNENQLIYTLPGELVTAGVGTGEYYIAKNKNTFEYPIVKIDAKQAYVSIDFVQRYTNLDYKYFENPSRVMITSQWGKINTATVSKNDSVRVLAGIKSKILSEAKKGDSVWVIGDEGRWKKVRTSDGYVGYIPAGSLTKVKEETISRDFTEIKYDSIKKEGTINMTFFQTTNKQSNTSFLTSLASSKGVNVVAPTWFNLANDDGDINSYASSECVNYAHQLGIEVWATVNDVDGGGDADNILNYTSKRQKLVNQLVSEAIQYNIDGINVDLEYVDPKSANGYIQFIRELSVKCHNNGISLSVDNYPPAGFNMFYNRSQQAVFADYVVVMAYDEHNKTTGAGSVASIGFVRQSVENTLKDVPAEKLVLGIPFYTRVWKEGGDELQLVSVSMNEAKSRYESNGANPRWLDDCGQYYVEYKNGGFNYKIWLEEDKSIEEKLKVMKEQKLAGVASWKLGLQFDSIWDVILKYTN